MGSDWDKNYRHNINVHNQISDLEKDWSTFLKTLPDNDSGTFRLKWQIWIKNRVMGSDWSKTYRHNINVYNQRSHLEKYWSTFLKHLTDNEDVKIFLFQENFDKKWNLDQELRVMDSNWDKTYRHNINVHNQIRDLEKDWSTFLKNLPDNEDVQIFLIQEHFYK